MSELVYTAQFVRLGAGSFGLKPKDATVLAQLLVGGSGVWIVAKTTPPFDGSGSIVPPFRISSARASGFDVLQAAFALAEPEVPLGEAQPLAEKLRKAASETVLELTDTDVKRLAAAVADLDVHLHLTHFSGGAEISGNDRGWIVSNAAVAPI